MPESAQALKPPGSWDVPGPLRQTGKFQVTLQLPGALWRDSEQGKKEQPSTESVDVGFQGTG